MSLRTQQQALELLITVLDLPTEDRLACLDRACGDDLILRREVEMLFESAKNVSDFMEEPAFSVHASDPDAGRRIGPYRLIQLLGRGGMGAVYLAVREDDFQQRVALKLIKRGMDTDEVIRRFNHERQILAELNHPNIARLLDGGSTPEGLPYFAMEYIEGEPFLEYCDARKLSVRWRLELFCKVCTAVQAAHQHLVVHCDLKPNNILVDATGEPHLLDFGIAKLLQPGASSATILPELRPMTPEYASPEQVRRQRVTTASDVYSLGVLLYELLTGHAPYQIDAPEEMVRVICEDEPSKPSSAVARSEEIRRTNGTTLHLTPKSTSRVRSVDPQRLRRCLVGDLDAITLRAMGKEPRHRYGSAAELADDIRLHLTGQPVRALRGTLIYRAGKFVRRNRWMLVGMMLVIGFALTTTVLWRRAVSGEENALRRQREVEQVIDFLVEVFRASTPNRARGEGVTARELLDRGRQRLTEELAEEPAIYAELAGIIGRVYRNLGGYSEAQALLGESVRVKRELYGEAHPDVTAMRNFLARTFLDLGHCTKAGNLWREVYGRRRQELGDRHPEVLITMSNLAAALKCQGRYEEARELYRQCLEIRQELYGAWHPKVAKSLNNLGMVLYNLGDFAEAERLLRQALEKRRQALEPGHTDIATTLNNLAMVLHVRGDLVAAEGMYLEALTIQRQRLGEKHINTAATERYLAWLWASDGRLEDAERLIRHALAVFQQTLPTSHWWSADAQSVLGSCLTRQGRYAEAEPLLVESYSLLRKALGEHTASTREARSRLRELYEAWGKPETAGKYRPTSRPGQLEPDPGDREPPQ